jgi:putative ABC transport system substrate-binding protein
MAAVNDPVEQGFVSSLAHPGGNITGFTFIDFQMVGKWLEMLKQAAADVSHAVLMFNPETSSHYYVYLRSFEAMPRSIAVEIVHQAGGAAPIAGGLSASGIRRARRVDVVWTRWQ